MSNEISNESQQTYHSTLFEYTDNSLERVIDRFCDLEKSAFGDSSMSKIDLASDLKNPSNIFIFLYDGETIIGVTHAKPVTEVYSERTTDTDTAIIWNTIIDKDYRGRGLVSILMTRLEEELKRRGYKYIERFAAVSNKYAENVQKYYGSRVIETYANESPLYGSQIFFRIRI